jgi:hypothetical protein
VASARRSIRVFLRVCGGAGERLYLVVAERKVLTPDHLEEELEVTSADERVSAATQFGEGVQDLRVVGLLADELEQPLGGAHVGHRI